MRSEPTTRCPGGEWVARGPGPMTDPWCRVPEEASSLRAQAATELWWTPWEVEADTEVGGKVGVGHLLFEQPVSQNLQALTWTLIKFKHFYGFSVRVWELYFFYYSNFYRFFFTNTNKNKSLSDKCCSATTKKFGYRRYIYIYILYVGYM